MGTSLEELYPDLGNKIKAFTDDVTKLKTTKLSNVSGYTNQIQSMEKDRQGLGLDMKEMRSELPILNADFQDLSNADQQ